MSQPGPQDRWTSARGTRPARIANCSGARSDPGYHMHRQATQGDVDFITGDYLAELNLASNAVAQAEGKHEGWEPTAWDGLRMSLDVIAEKRIKVAINGGALAPRRLAEKVRDLISEKSLPLRVAYVTGDDVLPTVRNALGTTGTLPYPHLDSANPSIRRVPNAFAFQTDPETHPLVSAHVYLGARAIVAAFEAGADVVIAGRVADASPVIGAAWYWHGWDAADWDRLAGALVAGHLIECSGYVTGGNFSGFFEYDLDSLVDVGFGIAEVAADGSCVVTKHEAARGIVNVDTVRCQFLYELQGTVYLNSDVKAYLDDIVMEQVGENRVKVTGIRGAPPPPTTKLAIFYKGGFQSQLLVNGNGYAVAKKYALQERQIRHRLAQMGLGDAFDVLEFQSIGTPAPNPRTQFSSTTYLRIFAQATTAAPLQGLLQAWGDLLMQHFAGWHLSFDLRTAIPEPFLAFFPALYPQDSVRETAVLLPSSSTPTTTNSTATKAEGEGKGEGEGEGEGEETVEPGAQVLQAGHPPAYEALEARANADPSPSTTGATPSTDFGPTVRVRLGDALLGRSGDKGSNVNAGFFPRSEDGEAWAWTRDFLTRERMRELVGGDWRDEYFVERCEMPGIRAVHFVVYGILGRGVSGSVLLDNLGKGFAEYIRDKVVDVPERFVRGLVVDREEGVAIL